MQLRERIRFARSSALATGLLCAILSSQSALAVLGGNVSSVIADQAHLKGSVRVMPATGYSVHEIVAPNGVQVREYVTPAGAVFAVAWSGPVQPDLRQLLGSYFDQYIQAARRRGGRARNIQEQGLVVQRGGHQRAFHGRAYLPSLLPAGVNLGSIQ